MLNQIYKTIVDTYGSIDNPNWSFVQQRLHNKLYEDVVAQFLKVAKTEETTDINDDYCRVLWVNQDGKDFTVCLSLVGRYACIYDGSGEFFDQKRLIKDFLGNQIQKILTDANFNILSEKTLRESIIFQHEPKILYSILFSSDEQLL